MKKHYFLLLAFLSTVFAKAEIIDFPNSAFKAVLLNANTTNPIAKDINDANMVIDANGDFEISDTEALAVYRLNVITFSPISNMTGISYFTNLRRLTATSQINVTSFDASALTNLTHLYFTSSTMTTLNVSNLTLLEELVCDNSNLTMLDVSDLQSVRLLRCAGSNLTSLDVSDLTNLVSLTCNNNELVWLDFENTPNLVYLDCNSNHLTALDFTNNANLMYINCQVNQLSELHFENLANLNFVDCVFNNLTELNLNGIPNLEYLFCAANQLIDLDLLGLPILKEFTCLGNQITTLDVTGLTQLVKFQAGSNNLVTLHMKDIGFTGAQNEVFGIGNNPNLNYICASLSLVPYVQSVVDVLGYTNCTVDSNCALQTEQFYNADFALYPNPTSDSLNIHSARPITSVEIYNTLGHLVLSSKDSKIDVSHLTAGNYFIRIHTESVTSHAKLIKK